MFNSPMQLMQAVAQLKNSGNPQQAMMGMFGNNPQFQQLMQMTRGANEQQLMGMVQQTCQQRGIDFNQLMQTFKSMGM